MPKSFRRTLGRHCFRRLSEKFRFSEFSGCRFSSVTCHPSPVPLARCARPLLPGQSTARPLGRAQVSVAASITGVGYFCGGCATRGGQRGPEPARHATRRRPTPLALRVSLPCQRTPVAPSPWPGKHGTCSLPPTGPRRPVPSSSPKAP